MKQAKTFRLKSRLYFHPRVLSCFVLFSLVQSCFQGGAVLASPAMTDPGWVDGGRLSTAAQASRRKGRTFLLPSKDKLSVTAGLRSRCSRCSLRVRHVPARSLKVIMLSKTLYLQWSFSRSPEAHSAFDRDGHHVLWRVPSVSFTSGFLPLLGSSTPPLRHFLILKPSLG